MEIVLTTPLYPPQIGGPATYTQAVEKEMKKRGHTVRVLCFSEVASLPVGIRHMVFFWKTLRLIRGADAVYAQDIFSVGLPTLFACRVLNKKFFVRVPGDFAWEQGVQRFGVKDSIDEFQKKRYGVRVELLRWAQKLVVRSAQKVVTPSTYFKDLVSKWTSKPERVVRVYNGIEALSNIKKHDFDRKTIVTAGRLVPWKGFDRLIDFIQETEYDLIIVGEGEDRSRLEQKITSYKIQDRVHLTGSLPREELFSYIKGAYAFILPSTFESFSFQLVEVLALGVPAIAFDIGNLSEIITHKENGYLVEKNNWDVVSDVLSNLEQERELISAQAMESSKRFSITQTVDSLEQEFAIKKSVVMVSTDRKIFDQNSTVFKRISDYADRVDMLRVVVFASTGFHAISQKGLEIIPTNSRWKILRIFDAIRIVLGFKNIQVITTQDPFETGLVGFLAGWGKRLQVQIHTDLYNIHFAKNITNIIRIVMSWFILLRANSVRVVSKRIKGSLPRFVQSGKVSVLPIYTELATSQNDLEISKPPYLLTVSRLEKEKNVDLLIRALERISHGVLHIVGEGSQKVYLQNLVTKLGLSDRVVFHGFQSDLETYYKQADVYMQASSYEGFGLTLIEAASYGIPIVSTNVGVVGCELSSEGVLVVNQNHPGSIARGVKLLLVDDNNRYNRVQNLLRDVNKLRIDYDQYLETYISLL